MSATLPDPTVRRTRAARALAAVVLLAGGLVAVAQPAAGTGPTLGSPFASLPLLSFAKADGTVQYEPAATHASLHAFPACDGSRIEVRLTAPTGWTTSEGVTPMVENFRAGALVEITADDGQDEVTLGSWTTPPGTAVMTTRDDLAPHVAQFTPGYVLPSGTTDPTRDMPVLADTVAVWPSQALAPSPGGGWVSPRVGDGRAVAYVQGDPTDPVPSTSAFSHAWQLAWDIPLPDDAESVTLRLARTDGVVETATATVPDFDPAIDCSDSEQGPVFTDVSPTSPFSSEISWLARLQITGGYDDGTFRPVRPVSRAAMAAFLYRFAGVEDYTPPADPPFSDVPVSSPFYAEIAWLAEQEITTGYPDGRYGPDRPVSRGAMAAFLARYSGVPQEFGRPWQHFADVPPGSAFEIEIGWLKRTGISTGYADNTFRPTQPVSRGAMAAFLYRFAGN